MQFNILAALGLVASAQAAAIGNVSAMGNTSMMAHHHMNTMPQRAVNVSGMANGTMSGVRRAANVSAIVNGTDAGPMNSATVVANINKITTVSSDANKVCSGLSFTNIPFEAPSLVKDIQLIVSLATGDVTAMKKGGMGTYSVSQQQPICRAFINFVHVHQALLRTVIGKHGLLAATPFTYPVAVALRGVEGIVDTLAFDIIGTVPSCAAQANKAKKQLDHTLKQAITTYATN